MPLRPKSTRTCPGTARSVAAVRMRRSPYALEIESAVSMGLDAAHDGDQDLSNERRRRQYPSKSVLDRAGIAGDSKL
jgi:hypothetical protein